jgi:hypothetical protein
MGESLGLQRTHELVLYTGLRGGVLCTGWEKSGIINFRGIRSGTRAGRGLIYGGRETSQQVEGVQFVRSQVYFIQFAVRCRKVYAV